MEGAYVYELASDLATATDWALHSLRISAVRSKDFSEICLAWPNNRPQCRCDAPASIGTTIDWLYLFSGSSSSNRSSGMYPVYNHGYQIDLFNLCCWIFCNQWSPMAG